MVYDDDESLFIILKNNFMFIVICFFFFQAEDGIRDLVRSRGLGDVYKRQIAPRLRSSSRYSLLLPTKATSNPEQRADIAMDTMIKMRSVERIGPWY